MSEKIPASFVPYQKKITPYLDGTLSANDRSEFEAFVATHPEFETYIQKRREEINLIKGLIPTVTMGDESRVELENEIRLSVFNLLKPEARTLWQSVELKIEDWLNR